MSDELLQNNQKNRSRSKALSNNVDFLAIQRELGLVASGIEFENDDIPKQLVSPKPRHQRSISDFVRPKSNSIVSLPQTRGGSIVADGLHPSTSTIQTLEFNFGREMSDIEDEGELESDDEKDPTPDKSDSAEEIEIDPAKIDDIQLQEAAAHTLSIDHDENESRTIFGSIREAVTASVRMAMDSRLAVRRNRHQMFRSLQREMPQGDNGDLLTTDLASSMSPGKNVFDQKNYRQCLQHPNLRPLGIMEVKRLWCALRFLIDEKNVEQFLRKYTPNTSLVGNTEADSSSPVNGPLDSVTRDVTLHYTHRFSSSGDVHLAPSLEGLMRQQTLATRTRTESGKHRSTLVNRHSLPNARRLSVKGLNGQDFRRASVAGTETSPKINALGLNTDSISSSVPDDLRQKENERFQLIFDQYFKPELERTVLPVNLPLPPIISVRPYEKRLYKNLCAFLLACLSIEDGADRYMLKLTQTALSYLRSIEECESSRVCKGFVNKIDNYLAILLFRLPDSEDDPVNGKSEFPFLKNLPQSKSNVLSSHATDDFGMTGSSITSDSLHFASLKPNLVRPPLLATSKPPGRLIGTQALIVACGLVVLLGTWVFLYPDAIKSAYQLYGREISATVSSALNVDGLVSKLALFVPKEVIDGYTTTSKFDTVEPHLALMASILPTIGASWMFLPDSGAFAAAIQDPSGSSLQFIERRSFASPCYRFNASSTWRKLRNNNFTVPCPTVFSTNTSYNWSNPMSIDGSSSSFGWSQIRLISSSKRTVALGMHFTTLLINEALNNFLIGKPQVSIVLRDAFSGQTISASDDAGGFDPQNSLFGTVTSSVRIAFANTTAEVVAGISIPFPLSNIDYFGIISIVMIATVTIVLFASWIHPTSVKNNSVKHLDLIRTVVDERPSSVFKREHVLFCIILVLTACTAFLLIFYISSDKTLQTISTATWKQVGDTLHERLKLLPAVASLVSSTVALQVSDGSINGKTSISTNSNRVYAVATDALSRMAQMPPEAMFAFSAGVVVQGQLYATLLPNASNPDPKTISVNRIDRDVNSTLTDWYRNSNSSGMFGSFRRLVSGNDALPFGRSVNVSGIGRCCVLVDFSSGILINYLKNFVSQIGLQSIALNLLEYPARTSLASTFSSDNNPYSASAFSSSALNDVTRIPVFDRDTLALSIPYFDLQTSWVASAVLSLHEVCGSVSELSLTAWTVFIGVTIIIVFLVYSSSAHVGRRHTTSWLSMTDSDAIVALAKKEPNRAALSHHLISIRSKIISASAQSWKRKRNLRSGEVGDYDQPLDFDEIQNHVSERAVRHVRDALHNRNILTLCELESRESPVAVGLYKLISHNFSRTVLLIVATIHIGLQFFEPQTQSELAQNGTDVWVLAIEGVCLLFEITYMSLHFGLKYRLLAMENVLSKVDNSLAIDAMTVIILALTCLDWLLTMTTNFSFEYACPLRPWIFLLFFADLRRGLSLFLRAMIRAFDVILLWMSIIFIFALFGVIFFRAGLNTDTNISSFGNIRDALITCFVFASNADNFSDLIYNPTQDHPLFMMYFIVLWMIGMFGILAMVVGCFQSEFMRQQEYNIQQKTLFTRTGMIAAFILIDVDQSGGISVEEFKDFISGCANHDAAATRRAFMKMFRNIDTNGDGQMDIYEFVMGIEDLTLNRLFLGRRRPVVDSKWKKWMRENVFHAQSDWWRKFIEFLLLAELTSACTYGTTENTKVIDRICHWLLLFFTTEMSTKMFVYGPTEMLVHGHYDGSMFERRFDTVVVFGAFITYYAVRFGYSSDTGFDQMQVQNILRVLQLIPVLRIFSQVKVIRHVITTFLRSAREFFNMFCLLLIIMDIYACIGVYFFAGLWQDPENPQANFDSHVNAFLSLIQCMVQQDWRLIMYNAISSYGWSASLYFLSFTFLIAILFTNLFLGIILTQFSKIVQHKRETKAALENPMLNRSQRALLDR